MSKFSDENLIEEAVGRGFLLRFGEYTLDPAQRVLLHFGKTINLKPRAFKVLEYLVERADRVVSKDEILEAVWNDVFVDESNLTVQISVLRKIFGSNGKSTISIDTIPKVGYRLNVESGGLGIDPVPVYGNGEVERLPQAGVEGAAKPDGLDRTFRIPFVLKVFLGGAFLVGLAATLLAFFYGGRFLSVVENDQYAPTGTVKPDSLKTLHCPRESGRSNLENGGCEEAVPLFSILANPNGNWSYGYAPAGNTSGFVLYDHADKNHFGSPETPIEMWRRREEWHPLVLRNTSPLTIVIQEAVVLPPNMFEMHPGSNGERSVLRWTAPANGHYQVQGQFRGLNTNDHVGCRTSTDALVIHNSKEVRFKEEITGYDVERSFDLTFKARERDTIDFSVGYGSNQNYECDSTGFSVIITTISLERPGDLNPK